MPKVNLEVEMTNKEYEEFLESLGDPTVSSLTISKEKLARTYLA